MKGTDKALVLGLAMVVVIGAFYFMVIGPKREKASTLDDEITTLQSSIDQQKQVVAGAEQARKDFPKYYAKLVVLGKAVPEQADSASMLVQLSAISKRTGVDFRGLQVAQGAGGGTTTDVPPPTTTAPASPETTPPPAEGAAPSSGSTTPPSGSTTPPAGGTTPPASGTATPAATTPAPATETDAANLPIGATVGPAGLPTLPYDLNFIGSYFDVAGFLSGVDSLVSVEAKKGKVATNGRLLTVDGFSMSEPKMIGGVPQLTIDFAVTSYVTPPTQGLTAGATPGGPAPAAPTAPETTPASAPVTP
jgi:Tfp pilus assembly protein PilO